MVIAGFALSLVLAAPAEGAERRILVLPIEVKGRDTQKFQSAVRDAVHRGLERGEYELVESKPAGPCADNACAGELARKADADFAVRVAVDASDRVYEIGITVVDAASARMVAEANDVCDLCGLEEVVQMVDQQAGSIRTRLDALLAEPPIVAFQSVPPAAIVELDGERLGPTPLERAVTPGEHRARALLDGYVPQERRFTAVVGVREVVGFELQRAPRKDKRALLRALGWSALGVGVAAVGVGATLIAIDRDPVRTRCTGDNVDPGGDCRYIYLTKGAGIGVVTTGGVLIATAVGLLVAGRERKSGRGTRSKRSTDPNSLGCSRSRCPR
jgi:hypothetical protein